MKFLDGNEKSGTLAYHLKKNSWKLDGGRLIKLNLEDAGSEQEIGCQINEPHG